MVSTALRLAAQHRWCSRSHYCVHGHQTLRGKILTIQNGVKKVKLMDFKPGDKHQSSCSLWGAPEKKVLKKLFLKTCLFWTFLLSLRVFGVSCMMYMHFIAIQLLERARISQESRKPEAKCSGPTPAAPDHILRVEFLDRAAGVGRPTLLRVYPSVHFLQNEFQVEEHTEIIFSLLASNPS